MNFSLSQSLKTIIFTIYPYKLCTFCIIYSEVSNLIFRLNYNVKNTIYKVSFLPTQLFTIKLYPFKMDLQIHTHFQVN